MALDLFPPSWWRAELKSQVVDFLRRLPIHPADKKRILLEWAKLAEAQLTAEDVEAATGERAGEI